MNLISKLNKSELNRWIQNSYFPDIISFHTYNYFPKYIVSIIMLCLTIHITNVKKILKQYEI